MGLVAPYESPGMLTTVACDAPGSRSGASIGGGRTPDLKRFAHSPGVLLDCISAPFACALRPRWPTQTKNLEEDKSMQKSLLHIRFRTKCTGVCSARWRARSRTTEFSTTPSRASRFFEFHHTGRKVPYHLPPSAPRRGACTPARWRHQGRCRHRRQGGVEQICVGCKVCTIACPFGIRELCT